MNWMKLNILFIGELMLPLTGDVVADRGPNVSSVRNDTVHDKLRKWKKSNNNQLRHQAIPAPPIIAIISVLR